MRLILVFLLIVLSVRAAASQSALLSGQSNARDQARFLPPDSLVLVARGNTSIRAWDWTDPAGDLGRQILEELKKRDFKVFIWWQGETDGVRGMSAREYTERLNRLIGRIDRPTIIVEMADHPTRTHLKLAQAELAKSERIALIDTDDLPHGDHDFCDSGRKTVTDRILRCYFVECWRSATEFK
jgi:hypothetical protein